MNFTFGPQERSILLKKLYAIAILVIGLVFPLLMLGNPPIDKSEYAARRIDLMAKIGDGIAIILGAKGPTTGMPFAQGSDFHYLTGVDVPNAALIIDGKNIESHLFLTLSEDEARGEGISLDLVHNPQLATGIESVSPIDRFSALLTRFSQQTTVFYTMFKPEELHRENSNEKFNALQSTMTLDIWDGRITRELQFVKNLRDKFPHITVKDCSSYIWNLRKIKSPAEIDLIRKAAQLGVKAHMAVMKAAGPGVREKELAALFEYTCKRDEAKDMAYNVIIMSGPNHAYGHYHIYDRTLQDGDFIILDAGPDVGYYNADISTTFPANGRFSPRQREIYEMAAGIYFTCLANYRPGVTFRDVGGKVREFLIQNGYDAEDPIFRGLIRYGGYNHSIGLATHDVMGSFAGPDEVLQPGFVFACDINIPYADEEMGIRIEDTVVITEEGYENLSDGLPRSLKEIESFMKGEK